MRENTLCIHLGFMPEEMTAKLKCDLKREHIWDQESMLIITRDNFNKNDELFEQAFDCYPSCLREAKEKQHYFSLFPQNPQDTNTTDFDGLKSHFEKFLNFNVKAHRLDGPKKKLPDGPPELTVLKIGTGGLRSIYLQFPEMGSQPVLALKLVMGLFQGILEWLAVQEKKPEQINCYSFGAGGALSPERGPGSVNKIKAVFSFRRWNKNNKFKSICTLRTLNDDNSLRTDVVFN